MKRLICLLVALLTLGALVSCKDETEKNAEFAAFSANGVTVPLDAEAEPIIEALGAYESFGESPTCYGDGKDKVYEYTSFKVFTYSSKGKDYILSVEIFSDSDASVATPEGIRIGSSAEDVLAKYGAAETQTDDSIVYLNSEAGRKLQFVLRDGEVKTIQYLKAE